MKRFYILLFTVLLLPSITFAATKPTAKANTKNPAKKTTTTKPATKPALKPTVKPQAFTYNTWLAYWDKSTSTKIAVANIDRLDSVSPFSYTVESDGTIIDSMYLLKEPWPTLNAAASKSKKKTKIIPTISWFKGKEIEVTLNDPEKRRAHVEDILSMVERNNMSGIEIDYEGKTLETKDGWNAFLTELSTGLHKNNKFLSCDIEARTPPEDRFASATRTPQYVNDYTVIGKQCDEVRLMTYDQRDDDRTLNKTRGEMAYYAPVADPAWVEKVVNLAAKEIPKNKIVVGIPTYGNVFKIWFNADGEQRTQHMRSITYTEALKRAAEYGIYPARSETGERTFHYTKDGSEYTVSFQDAESIKQKIALAKKLGVKGVAIFKIDERADQDYWKHMN